MFPLLQKACWSIQWCSAKIRYGGCHNCFPLGTKNTKTHVNYSRGAAQTSGWWVPARLRAPHALTEATTLWGMLAGSTIWNQNWKIYFLMNYCSSSQLLIDRWMGLWLASKQESWMHLAATRMRHSDKTQPLGLLSYCIMHWNIILKPPISRDFFLL